MYRDGGDSLIITTGGAKLVLWRGWEQDKNQINPLERMEGVALAAMLPPWSYKSELLTPKPEAYHHLPYRRSPSSPRR